MTKKRYNEQEVLDMLLNYHRYSKIIDNVLAEVDKVFPRTQNYGLEATLPKAPYGKSDPTSAEVAMRERNIKSVERYAKLVRLVQAFDETTHLDKLNITTKLVYSLTIAGKKQWDICLICEVSHTAIAKHQKLLAKAMTAWLNDNE